MYYNAITIAKNELENESPYTDFSSNFLGLSRGFWKYWKELKAKENEEFEELRNLFSKYRKARAAIGRKWLNYPIIVWVL
jgi:hypothetical protein